MHLDEPANLTIAETVFHYRIGRTRLYELIASGKIEAVKLGRRTLVRTSSVHDFFASLPAFGDCKNQ